MQKEIIPFRQAMCMLLLFLFGSSVVMGVTTVMEQDAWASLLLGAAFFIPLALIYARIIRLYPGKDLFDILETLFGKIIGKLITALLCWYAVHLGGLVLRNFSEFIQVVSMPETPQLPLMVVMLLVTVYLAKSGVESLGRWSLVAMPAVLLIVLLTVVLSLGRMEYTNLQPVLAHGANEIAASAYSVLAFPFAETVLLLSVANAIKKQDSPYKLYLYATLLGALMLLIIILRNLCALGAPMLSAEYFPSYTAARVINVGDFFTRIEGTISMNFILAGITKITLCLLAASKGAARLFGIRDYRQIVLPVSLFALALCAIVHKNAMEMFDFLSVYQYYVIPFQIVIPLAVWVAAEIKSRRQKKRPRPDKQKKAVSA